MKRVIENPLVGDRVTFLKTSRETGGKYLYVKVELAPKGGNGLHYHTAFAEKFEALDGVLGVHCGGQELQLRPGQSAEVPPRTLHRFYNPSETETITFQVTITPAGQFEQCLRLAYGLATDGKCRPNGAPKNFWHTALLMEMGETYFPNLPLGLQQGLFRLLSGLARLLGKHKEVEHYYREEAVGEAANAAPEANVRPQALPAVHQVK
ncbi:MAG TPA: cupin domain-containing protein [Cytophagales bacterium]